MRVSEEREGGEKNYEGWLVIKKISEQYAEEEFQRNVINLRRKSYRRNFDDTSSGKTAIISSDKRNLDRYRKTTHCRLITIGQSLILIISFWRQFYISLYII